MTETSTETKLITAIVPGGPTSMCHAGLDGAQYALGRDEAHDLGARLLEAEGNCKTPMRRLDGDGHYEPPDHSFIRR